MSVAELQKYKQKLASFKNSSENLYNNFVKMKDNFSSQKGATEKRQEDAQGL